MRERVVYLVLILSFIASFLLSFYYYFKASNAQQEILESTLSINKLPAYHFVLIGEEIDNDYWRLVGQGAKEAEEYYDVYVEYKGPRRSNLEEQMKLVDMATKANVDGIIVQALNDEKFTPVIEKAVNEGIPVITVDTDAAESLRSTYIGTNNYLAGKMAGTALIEDTKGQANVGIITGSYDSAHHQLRVEGFLDAVKDAPGIKVLDILESNITRVGAEERAYRLLKEFDEITAFFGTSALDGIGISQAVQSFNKKDEFYIISFDTLPETIELLQQGLIDATVAQEPFEIGFQSVQRMLDIMEGININEIYYTNATIIRPETLGTLERISGGIDD